METVAILFFLIYNVERVELSNGWTKFNIIWFVYTVNNIVCTDREIFSKYQFLNFLLNV